MAQQRHAVISIYLKHRELSPMSAAGHSWPHTVALLIPAYRAQAMLKQLLPRLLTRVPAEQIVVVDDGSGDATPTLCANLGISIGTHKHNRGKGAALRTGFSMLCATRRYEWIITMDADGQHSPDDLDVFIAAIQRASNGAMIIGARSMKIGHMPPSRIFSNRTTSALLGLLCGQSIADSQCGYRAYATSFLQQLTTVYDRFEMESEVILKAARMGYRIEFVPVRTLYLGGGSHINHLADTLRWLVAVIKLRFTQHPGAHTKTHESPETRNRL